MGHVVSCPHCGAPAALSSGQTRFTCAWCGGLGADDLHRGALELMVEAPLSHEAARRAAQRWLTRKGLRGTRLWVRSPDWIPYWHVVNHRGEEHVLCGKRGISALAASLRIPATNLRVRRESDAALPRPDVDAEGAIAAARATFDNPDAVVQELRLIWLPVMELSAWTAAGSVRGIYVGGSGHVVFEPLPKGAPGDFLEPAALFGYLGYLLLAFGLGSAMDSPLWRALTELLLLGGAMLLWRAIFRTQPGRS